MCQLSISIDAQKQNKPINYVIWRIKYIKEKNFTMKKKNYEENAAKTNIACEWKRKQEQKQIDYYAKRAWD